MEKASKEKGITINTAGVFKPESLHAFQQIQLYSIQLTINYIPIG